MIDRYCRPEMAKIWSKSGKLKHWLEIELAVVRSRQLGRELGESEYRRMEDVLEIDEERMEELEAETRHDMIAFIEMLAEQLPDEISRFLHHGLTSSDIKDTARALQMKSSLELLQDDLASLQEAVAEKARRHKFTPMVGRTHGIQAEPISFGLKLASWYSELDRHQQRLKQLKPRVIAGKISGAVGTYSGVDPETELEVLEELGLERAPVSTQIVQRDRQAELINYLGLLASSLERFAQEIRNLQRTELDEVEEGFKRRQKGSSAMPHKKNPIVCERICGLARVVRGNTQPAMENIPLWHERDLTHSSVERIVLPDSLILSDYMLAKFRDVLVDLKVREDKMRENMNVSRGLIFSQRLLLALTDRGLSREDAYELVQELAWQVWEGEIDFREAVRNDERVREHLEAGELDKIFDRESYLQHVDHIFQRAGL